MESSDVACRMRVCISIIVFNMCAAHHLVSASNHTHTHSGDTDCLSLSYWLDVFAAPVVVTNWLKCDGARSRILCTTRAANWLVSASRVFDATATFAPKCNKTTFVHVAPAMSAARVRVAPSTRAAILMCVYHFLLVWSTCNFCVHTQNGLKIDDGYLI